MVKENRSTSLTLVFAPRRPGDPEPIRWFFPLLQQGFTIRARVGFSIRELLCDQFGIRPDYLSGRITTIFLNSRAIDDPASSRVAAGATLALSAAMPGLVGATMRCGGYYSAMRSDITHHDFAGDGAQGNGEIRVKLFNLLMAELGPGFLARGIRLPALDLAEFLAAQTQGFWEGCRSILLEGRTADPGLLKDSLRNVPADEPVALRVLFEESEPVRSEE
jgi:hypothetical protein